MPSFLAPAWLALLSASVPLVLLYVLKTRRQRVRVSSAALFVLARREAKARDPWKRLVPEIALILQLLALIALALAAARPVSRGAGIDADAVVLVIDRSASMATRVKPLQTERADGSPTRMTRAKERALAVLDAAGIGAEFAIVAAGRDARVLSPLGRDRRLARDAIASIGEGRAGEGGLIEGDLQSALDVARDLLRARAGRKKVVLLTDGALASTPTWLDEDGGAALDVALIDAPNAPSATEREGNVGIVRIDVRRGPSTTSADRVDVGVALALYGTPIDGRARFVTLRRIDRTTALDAQKIEIGATGRATATLGFSPAADGSDELATLVIELSPNDALAVDDAAQIVVPPSRRMPVVLSSLGVGGASWLAKALGSDPDVKLVQVTPERLTATPTLDPWALVVAVDSCPTSLPGAGDLLVVNPPAGACAGRRIGAALEGGAAPPITSWSPSDPRLRYVELDDVHLGRVLPIGPLTPSDADVRKGAELLGAASLVRAEGLAIVADASTLDRTVTIWGFDPADGDLARKSAFVFMVRDAVDGARARRDRSWAPSTHGGLPARVAASPGAKEIVAKRLTPAGTTSEAPVRAPVIEGIALLEGVDRPGPYALEGAATYAPLTVSLLSERESDSAKVVEVLRQRVQTPATPTTTAGAEAASASLAVRAKADFRWLVAIGATVILMLDALWLTRRDRRVVARLTKLTKPATPTRAPRATVRR